MHVFQDHLFLKETDNDFEPKVITYNLDTLFVVTNDTVKHPTV